MMQNYCSFKGIAVQMMKAGASKELTTPACSFSAFFAISSCISTFDLKGTTVAG